VRGERKTATTSNQTKDPLKGKAMSTAAAEAAAAAAVTTKADPTIEDLLGPSLLKDAAGNKSTTKSLLAGKQFVLLYFSASWCPPCKAFTPVLKDFYQAHKKNIEIVYLSSDRKVEEFVEYYGQMPWTALDSVPHRQALATTLKITGIPALIVLEIATAKLITMDGRTDVMNNKKDGAMAKWQATEPKAIGEAVPGEQRGIVRTLIMTVLSNPLYIFGTLYIIKWLMRKISAMNDPTGGSTTTGEPAKLVAPEEAVSDDEF
jgi:nucleoredoxin